MKNYAWFANKESLLGQSIDRCTAKFWLSHFGTLVGVLGTTAVLFLGPQAQAQVMCAKVHAPSGPGQTRSSSEITDLNSFGRAITEGMQLNPNQADIFEVYLRTFFGDPTTSIGNDLRAVTDIQKRHPELDKPLFQEFLISTVEKVYETPQALDRYIRSQTASAGQVRSNLYQIDANLSFWRKVLDRPVPSIPENLKPLNLGRDSTDADRARAREINQARTQWLEQEQKRFVTYLNRIINKTNRDLLANLRNEHSTYKDKATALFKTLQYIESWMEKRGRNTSTIRQAMVDLVYTVGYGNKSTLDLLKSDNAQDKIQGLRQLWSEADGFAQELGFASHFVEIKQRYRIEFPTGLSKNEDPQRITESFQAQLEQMPFTTKPTDSIRVRSLSLQESPFRSCLGKDCSSRTYFDKALDPNYIYFTMTDSAFHSDGHATVVLGTAKDQNTNQDVKVAFLDKLQNIPTNKIELFLNAVDQSLQTQGYRLAIPTDLGKHIPGHGGISNMDIITDFVQSNIMPRLHQVKDSFTPHPHQYQFSNSYSRGDQRLQVRLFEAKPVEPGTEITPGERQSSFLADRNLNKEQLAQSVLSLRQSDNPEDVIKFISMADGIIRLGLYSKDQFTKDLEQIMLDINRQTRLRKQALYASININGDISPLKEFAETLSDQDLNQILSEIFSFRNSTNPRLKKVSQVVTLVGSISSPRIFAALLRQPGIDVNAKDVNGNTALHLAAESGQKEVVELLLKDPRVDVIATGRRGLTALRGATEKGQKEVVELLLKDPRVDVNEKGSDGITAFHSAVIYGRKEIVELLLKDPRVDVNEKGRDGITAFHSAVIYSAIIDGRKEIVELLLKDPRVDVNEKSSDGMTALHIATEKGYKKGVELLLKDPRVDVNAKGPNGQTLREYLRDMGYEL